MVTQIKQLINRITPDGDAKAALSGLKDSDYIDMFNALVENDVKGLETLRKRFLSKTNQVNKRTVTVGKVADKAAALQSAVEDLRSNIQGLREAGSEARQAKADLVTDTAGRQTLQVPTPEGNKVWEIEPDLYRVLKGMNEDSGFLEKVSHVVPKVMSFFLTGAGSIFFPLKNTIAEHLISVVDSPYGAKTLYRGAGQYWRALVQPNNPLSVELGASGHVTTATFSGIASKSRLSAQSVESGRNIGAWIAYNFHPTKGLSGLGGKIDVAGGRLANAKRQQLAKLYMDEYSRANPNATRAEVLAEGRRGANEVLGDMERTTALIRAVGIFQLYAPASMVGLRAAARSATASKAGAAGFASRLTATIGMPATVATLYTQGSPEAQNFYNDMKNSDKMYVFDNLAFVTPWAHKDEETGVWTGVYFVPTAPDYRGIVNSIQVAGHQAAYEDGVDLKRISNTRR